MDNKLNDKYKQGRKDMKSDIKKIVNDWRDTSIKDKTSSLAVMVTNGGYISKFDLLDVLEMLE